MFNTWLEIVTQRLTNIPIFYLKLTQNKIFVIPAILVSEAWPGWFTKLLLIIIIIMIQFLYCTIIIKYIIYTAYHITIMCSIVLYITQFFLLWQASSHLAYYRIQSLKNSQYSNKIADNAANNLQIRQQ